MADYRQMTLRLLDAIRAYHGSPHKFDKFDISKIGTGEGGQTFGRGLYFSEHPKVADIYARPPEGYRYEVNINAKPEQFLDWSAVQQSPLVRGAASSLPTPPPRSGQPFGPTRIVEDDAGQWFLELSGDTRTPLRHHDMNRLFGMEGQPLTGQQVYHRAAGTIGDQAVTDRLRQGGVAGIRYPDEHRYPNTNNYTVFDDSLIDILRRYGIAAGITPPAAAAALSSGDQ